MTTKWFTSSCHSPFIGTGYICDLKSERLFENIFLFRSLIANSNHRRLKFCPLFILKDLNKNMIAISKPSRSHSVSSFLSAAENAAQQRQNVRCDF